ncbi:unnamed protein product [Cunninghamella blakesleeana]
MPTNFSKEWIHSSYGLPSSIFNQLRNNNPNLNQDNNFESSNNRQETQSNENSTTITNPNNTGQERQRQVTNDPISVLNNQFSFIDEQNKLSSTKHTTTNDTDDHPSSHSSSLNTKNTNSNSNNNPMTNINTRDQKNDRSILNSAQSTNSIDSNHAVVDEPLSMESKSKTAEKYNDINDKDYGNLLPTKETKLDTTTTNKDENQVFNQSLPMGHNRGEESKVLPINKNIMPGTFNPPVAPSLPIAPKEEKNEIKNMKKDNENDHDHDQYDTSFINSSTEPAIASIIAGSAISTDNILTKGDLSTTEKTNSLNTTNPIKKNDNKNDVINSSTTTTTNQMNDHDQKPIEKTHQDNNNNNNNNNNKELEKMDSLHPLTSSEQSEKALSSSEPSSTTDPFHFEKNNIQLNNDRGRRKSLSADQCATALPVLGSYVPFAQGVAVTINSRQRYNQESQRRASTDRRYSLNNDTMDHPQQHQSSETNDTTTNTNPRRKSSETNDNTTNTKPRRKSSLTAGIEKLLHIKKKSK